MDQARVQQNPCYLGHQLRAMLSGHNCCIPAMVLHSKHQCPNASSSSAAKYEQKTRFVLFLGVACYPLHADDWNMFHLIYFSLAICYLHGSKQKCGYCWLCKIWTGNNCYFTQYKITLVVLHMTKWLELHLQDRIKNFGCTTCF